MQLHTPHHGKRGIACEWDGETYGSRTEARWAVFFSFLRVKFTHDPTAGKTKLGWHKPDFFVPILDAFVEVKGHTLHGDWRESDTLRIAAARGAALSDMLMKSYVIVVGAPNEAYVLIARLPGAEWTYPLWWGLEHGSRLIVSAKKVEHKRFRLATEESMRVYLPPKLA